MPVVNPAKKAAPSIPRVVLLEPALFLQKPIGFLQESGKFFFRAGNGNRQGMAVIQGEHTHEAAAVDMVVVVTYGEGEGLQCCPGDKILNIPAAVKANMELLHFYPPQSYTKFILSCIMGKKSQTDSMKRLYTYS